MARLNIEDSFWKDAGALVAAFGDLDRAYGHALRFLELCQRKYIEGAWISEEEFKAHGFSEALFPAFAQRTSSGIQALASDRHFSWIMVGIEQRREAGKARAAGKRDKMGRLLPKNLQRDSSGTPAEPSAIQPSSSSSSSSSSLRSAAPSSPRLSSGDDPLAGEVQLDPVEIREPSSTPGLLPIRKISREELEAEYPRTPDPQEGLFHELQGPPRPRKAKNGQGLADPSSNRLARLWNEHRDPKLPSVVGLTGERLRKANARWKEMPSEEAWTDVVRRISKSPFCLGKGPRGWKANFDFLIRPETRHKVLEGQFDEGAGSDDTNWDAVFGSREVTS